MADADPPCGPAPSPGGAPLLAVAAVSFGALLLELALTRLFSVVLFYHFAFLAISVALLGLGAGGVFAHVRRERLARWDTRALAAWLSAAGAISIVLALVVSLRVPITIELTRTNFERLTLVYLLAAVPFALVGVLLSVVFARESRAVARLYGADLLGGAAAAALTVPLLTAVGGPNTILLAAASMALAALLWARSSGGRALAACLCAALLALAAANREGALLDVVYTKGVFRDPRRREFVRWNALSRVEVEQFGPAKHLLIDSGAASVIVSVDPRAWDVEMPDGPPGSAATFSWRRFLMSTAPAVANVLRPRGDFAIIGPGGGIDVLRAAGSGSPRITGIEINPIIADEIMRGAYADYSYHVYDLPQVHIHVADGRSFIRASEERFDVIQMTVVDTWASTAAGAIALSENSLYTVEAFLEYFDHLRPDGMIAITRWEFRQPREALRVVSQAIEALARIGVSDPRRHIIVVSEGELDTDGRPVVVLAKRSPFTEDEEATLRAHLSLSPGLVPLYTPSSGAAGSPPPPPSPPGATSGEPDRRAFRDLVTAPSPRAFAAEYPYDISAVTDDAPFFFFTFRTGRAWDAVWRGGPRGFDWHNNLGVAVLGLLLVISLGAVLLFLILPLAIGDRARRPRGARAAARMAYFIAIGLGYILVEVALIQRFVLFLGHPTYALTVVVFLMLLASGAGSLLAPRWIAEPVRVRRVLAAIVLALLVYLAALPAALAGAIGLPFAAKLLVCAAALVPPAFAMGMPFPTGMRALDDASARVLPAAPGPEAGGALCEWAYALNAAASVLGSVLAMLIAIHFGLFATLAAGAAAYLVALGLAGALRPR